MNGLVIVRTSGSNYLQDKHHLNKSNSKINFVNNRIYPIKVALGTILLSNPELIIGAVSTVT
jgi:hypothetical protein